MKILSFFGSFHGTRAMHSIMRPAFLATTCAILSGSFFTPPAAVLRAATPPSAPQFTQEHSDLKADPAAKFGTLKNGLRYVIMRNADPKNRASLRLLVMAGSLQENDDQRGLAHFLEHLAFNGSAHYPPGTLIEFFQRMGMNFGGDSNASTSFASTQYKLELPGTKPETLAEGFTVFADYAGGLLLEQASIDKERGIILSEKRARDSVAYRNYIANFESFFGKTRIPSRMPIGETSVIEHASRDRFIDYYNTWYRPERMAVIAVGDFNAAAVEKQIVEKFSGIIARAPARSDPDLGTIENAQGVRALYHYEAEAPITALGIQIITQKPNEPDTAATRLSRLPRTIALIMLNRRLDILAKTENSAFIAGSAEIFDDLSLLRSATIQLTCQPYQWPAALATAEHELRRAMQLGFTDAELQQATKNFLGGLKWSANSSATRHSDALAEEITAALVNDHVFTTPAAAQTLLQPAIKKLTTDQCRDALRAAFAAPGRCICVNGNAQIDGDAKAKIMAVYNESATTAVTAPVKISNAKFAYDNFGSLGKIATRRHIDDLDLDLVTYANNVRLNIKKTDFESREIQISVRIGTGQLTQPKDKPGLSPVAADTLINGGLGKHSADELDRILAGRYAKPDFEVANDALVFTVATRRKNLLFHLQFITAYITDPGYRPESLRQSQKKFEEKYKNLAHTLQGPLNFDMPRIIFSGDNRFALPKKSELFARTLDEVREWLAPQFATGPIEIAIVGDIDPDATLKAVAGTLGALPARAAKPALEAERRVTIPAPESHRFVVDTEIPKGALEYIWPTTDGRDIGIARRLSVLAAILNDRLRVTIREKLGDSYSPSVTSECSTTYLNYGFLDATVIIDPAKEQLINETIAAIADDLHKNGVTEDELTRAKQPILTALREDARANAYWLQAVLSAAQEFPQRLDWCRTRYTDFESITKAQLDALAKKYLAPQRAFRATILPAK